MKPAKDWADELQQADSSKPWRRIITPEQIACIQDDAINNPPPKQRKKRKRDKYFWYYTRCEHCGHRETYSAGDGWTYERFRIYMTTSHPREQFNFCDSCECITVQTLLGFDADPDNK